MVHTNLFVIAFHYNGFGFVTLTRNKNTILFQLMCVHTLQLCKQLHTYIRQESKKEISCHCTTKLLRTAICTLTKVHTMHIIIIRTYMALQMVLHETIDRTIYRHIVQTVFHKILDKTTYVSMYCTYNHQLSFVIQLQYYFCVTIHRSIVITKRNAEERTSSLITIDLLMHTAYNRIFEGKLSWFINNIHYAWKLLRFAHNCLFQSVHAKIIIF